jgi:hypothetical protein
VVVVDAEEVEVEFNKIGAEGKEGSLAISCIGDGIKCFGEATEFDEVVVVVSELFVLRTTESLLPGVAEALGVKGEDSDTDSLDFEVVDLLTEFLEVADVAVDANVVVDVFDKETDRIGRVARTAAHLPFDSIQSDSSSFVCNRKHFPIESINSGGKSFRVHIGSGGGCIDANSFGVSKITQMTLINRGR